FFFQCGNFAVLVDVHVLPQGSSKDTSWFSDHEKEEVCMLLEEVVASRVKHYLEKPRQRGQWKSMQDASSGPLFLTASSFHITAYFMKRWVNLRCAVGKHYRDLRVFPDRFVVCVSKLESNPSAWTCENNVLKELSSGKSEYFAESGENEKCERNWNEQVKQDILKEIVKRTKTRKTSIRKPQMSKDSKKVYLGAVDSQTGSRENDCQTSHSPQSEVKHRSMGLLKDCTNTAESNVELLALELENYVNQRQPDDVSSQQKPHSLEWLKSSLLSENPLCSSESALLGPKQSQTATKTQAQQKSCGSEEKLEHLKKVSSEETPLIPSSAGVHKCDSDCLDPFLERNAPLNSSLFSKQDVPKTVSDEESVTLRKALSQSLSMRNNAVQMNQTEQSTTTEELPEMLSSCSVLQPLSSEKLLQKRKKEDKIGLGKLKLRRLKK
ncbi:SLX4I protein, partial [Rhinopomastus cyanomelas]|nr:SLX4I protein [Rhinopomastus cyanomelas]